MNLRFYKNFDFFLFLPMFLLICFSLLVIYSANAVQAHQQLIFSGVGLLIYFLAPFFDYRWLKRLSFPIFMTLILALLSVKIFGEPVRGSVRWINFGEIRFQPSEFTKLALIIVLADFFRRRLPLKLNFYTLVTIAFSFIIVVIPAVLVFIQPDFGTAFTLFAIWSGMLLISGVPLHVVVAIALIALSSMPLIWGVLKDYQKVRILTFLNPHQDPLGAGYNVLQAVIATGSGQIFGRGFGRGTQSHLRFLPEHHTDFIFASLAEEWGLVGSILLLSLFFLLLFRILIIARRSRDNFGLLICVGVCFLLLSQIFINIGMNLGIMPITGIPLPLVSYGGSSLLAQMINLSLVQNVAMRVKT